MSLQSKNTAVSHLKAEQSGWTWCSVCLLIISSLRGSLVSKAAWDSGSDDLWEKFWAECIKTGRLPVSLEKSLVSCATSCVNDLRTNSWQVTTSMLAITKIMKLKQIWFETNLKISDCWSLWLDHVRQRDRGVANQNISTDALYFTFFHCKLLYNSPPLFYEHFLNCDTCFNWLPWSIMSVGPGKVGFGPLHLT